MKNFHCCATCVNFKAEKAEKGTRYFCSRLGYETRTAYQFNCWQPRAEIKRLMNKQVQKDKR